MRYEEKDEVIGWNYTKRTEPELIIKNLSCIAEERKEVEFIPPKHPAGNLFLPI